MILRTARLVLRRATWDDLPALHRVFSNPAAMRYWSRPEHETEAETRRWMADLVDPREGCVDFGLVRAG